MKPIRKTIEKETGKLPNAVRKQCLQLGRKNMNI